MSKVFFNSVVHKNEPPKRVNNLVPVKPRKSSPAEKASQPFSAILDRARSKFVTQVQKKYNTASANEARRFRSILTREKPPVKVS